jgi:D-serine deaminase-like pyridoxal phosphate-dependent protein
MAAAGVATDLLLANESLDGARLAAMAERQDDVRITVAIDSVETIAAAAAAGVVEVLVDVNVGLRRCGCAVEAAGSLADHARRSGLVVRGVMGYEGHLMGVVERAERVERLAACVAALLAARDQVGGEVVSTGGTGTYDLHDDRVTEIQAGSYALMDTHYARLGLPFGQALHVLGTVISTSARWAVADVGLKALGMDHGNPSVEGADVWFCSDEHITYAPVEGTVMPRTGHRVLVTPAHCDPTMALHERIHVVRGDEVLDTWPIDLRGW